MIISQFYQNERDCDRSGDRLSKNDKNGHICIRSTKNCLLVSNKKYGTLSIYIVLAQQQINALTESNSFFSDWLSVHRYV